MGCLFYYPKGVESTKRVMRNPYHTLVVTATGPILVVDDRCDGGFAVRHSRAAAGLFGRFVTTTGTTR